MPAPLGVVIARLHARGIGYAEIAAILGLPIAKVLGLAWLARCGRGGAS